MWYLIVEDTIASKVWRVCEQGLTPLRLVYKRRKTMNYCTGTFLLQSLLPKLGYRDFTIARGAHQNSRHSHFWEYVWAAGGYTLEPSSRFADGHKWNHRRDCHGAVGTGQIVGGYLRGPQPRVVTFWPRLNATSKTSNSLLKSLNKLWGIFRNSQPVVKIIERLWSNLRGTQVHCLCRRGFHRNPRGNKRSRQNTLVHSSMEK